MLIVSTKEDLANVIREVLGEMRVAPLNSSKAEPGTAEEVPGKVARKMLVDKGYCVKSWEGFNSFVKDHGLTMTKRGRENWYKTTQIMNIPDKN
jgi:hypothetical protein